MELAIRPMMPEERNYSYRQSQQISMQTGLIGHLRADMDSNGFGFFSDWNDFRESLKNEAFKAEFDDVINELRKEGGFLHDRKVLSKFCDSHAESAFHNGRDEYGFRVDSDHYSYMMRLNPNRGEYNLYCYCYVRQWLDRHLDHAAKGIRFITPNYDEKFRVADGDKIRIITRSGDYRERVCRYIDDYHMELSGPDSNNLYHICEFAERFEERGCQDIIPLRASLPEKCFTVLESTGEMVIVERGQKGYRPVEVRPDSVTSREGADAANKAMGVSKAQEAAMVAGSMFGWSVPAADPKNYDENGTPIRPKQRDRGDAR